MKKFLILLSSVLLVSCVNSNLNVKKFPSNNNIISTEDIIENGQEITKKYKNIIMFIGDGMGPNHVDAGGIYLGKPLCFDVTDDKWTYHAYSNTDSLTSEGFTLDTSKSLLRPEENPSLYDGTPSPYDPSVSLGASGNITTYTDSAAGGTALATGVKVTNSRIGLDINGDPIENLVEMAKGLNKKTGVVSSDTLVGATPSSFLVHVGDRYMEDEIIREGAISSADLILTKKPAIYTKNQAEYESLYIQNGYDVSYTKDELYLGFDKQIGLFDIVAPKQDPRGPSLEELTVYSLDKLDNENGFFLMVEGANIDKKSHSNSTKLMMNELLGFNDAIEAACEWAASRDDTLMVVTADHETGGLYYNRETATQDTILSDIKWLTFNHSRTRVDIAIYGDISEYVDKYGNEFSSLEGVPYWDNTDVFKLCATYLNG